MIDNLLEYIFKYIIDNKILNYVIDNEKEIIETLYTFVDDNLFDIEYWK